MAPDRPLRIALFTGNYVHIEDGVSRTLGRLVGHLLGRGHEVMILGPTVEHPPVRQPGRFVAVPSVPIPGRAEYRFSLRFPSHLRSQVAAFDPDVVHVATPDVLGHKALAWARARNLPVVSTYHTHFVSYLHYYRAGFAAPAAWSIGRRFYNRCDDVLVPAQTLIDELRAHGITAPMRLWPRGIERDRFSPSFRSETWRAGHGFSSEEIVVSFVSRLVKEKGLDVFIEVVRSLQQEGLPVAALIVGDGPEREALSRALPRGVFTGHLSATDLSTAYASSDVFLFPSETETFGNVTLEAMASGLPAVCADAAGSRSLVEPERTGLLCPPRSSAAFLDATRRLVLDAALRRRMGAAAVAASEAYDWTRILDGTVGAYREAISGRRNVRLASHP